mgnify:CR=1 FL=1
MATLAGPPASPPPAARLAGRRAGRPGRKAGPVGPATSLFQPLPGPSTVVEPPSDAQCPGAEATSSDSREPAEEPSGEEAGRKTKRWRLITGGRRVSTAMR